MIIKIFLVVSLSLLSNAEIQVIPWTPLVQARRIDSTTAMMGHLRSALNESIHGAWELFKITFNRKFTHSLEHVKRFEIFAMNFIKAHIHNKKYQDGKVSYQMKINKFSDRTPAELKTLKCLKVPPYRKLKSNYEMKPVKLPVSIDWRAHGAVTPVKNQGSCGSCWAFSSTGAIEGHYFLNRGPLTSFSEQQLVDCSSDFGNNGCDGGFMDNAFKYVEQSHGLNTEDEYPYVSGNTTQPNPFCYYNKSAPHVRVTGFVDLQQFDEHMLMHAVATKGPVSIAINAAESFPYYHSGVYSDENCLGDMDYLNHGVLLVGYGEENDVPYWLVKNSWGPDWGEGGYIKILRNGTNMCGVATLPSYPTVQPL